ncbi:MULTISPECIES: hypothetical protein [unclassified Ruminococcus]|uniref:hypothetical protein n=1 Tax=unclassified Ruminococcus TaxID=2608920 RepID=UPI002108D38F|nr:MULTISPECIES: hypothetical protein [unclassified Ruminococcus]MCQ4022881.1 hypothetical protein [Ruminococcus sp. zg-924]MCQ4115303.1 hypothetical protein [Ruminococcus sp. zg-921]
MEDMLAKIVEMDEKARELTEEANREKVNSEADIAKAKEDVYNNYIEKARKRIAKNEITERKAADEELEKFKLKQKESLERLEKTFSENCDKWVDGIVTAVINS